MTFSHRATGGVERSQQLGTWTAGMPLPEPKGTVISQCGWADRPTLIASGIDKLVNTGVPQFWLCGGSGELAPVIQRFALPDNAPYQLISRHGKSVGVRYADADAEYALLTGVLPADPTASPTKQTASVFEEIEAALNEVGMDFSNIARNWLYMDRILEWYDPFNRARDEFFRSRKVYDSMVPASTGIGSANLFGTAIAASTIAVKPKRPGSITVQSVDSPLQCTAQAYGSSFSRAVEIGAAGYRSLLISGTASIAPGGATAHIGDETKQLELTLDVVEAILQSRGMGWGEATRGVMYLKKPEFFKAWQQVREKRGIAEAPISAIVADICRDDLLVELELDAVMKTES